MNSTQAATAQAVADPDLKILPIERRLSKDLPYDVFLREYVVKNRPVIIENAVPQWNALRVWTPEFFKSRFGTYTVDVTYGVKMNFVELIDAVLASTTEKPGPYLHKVIIHQDMPELLPDMTPENIYGFPQRYCSPLMPKHWQRPDGFLKLLIGGVGGKFPLMHFDVDNSNAMITEIYGDKEFVLFAPEDTPYVYPTPNPGSPTSAVDDLDHPDLNRFPLFPKATQYRGVIRPGDAAFVPSRWWHSARVVSTSISVCTNFVHRANWPGFVTEACDPANGRGLAGRLVKRTYLNMAGAAMQVVETLQQKFPNAGLSRRLSFLSPISRVGSN